MFEINDIINNCKVNVIIVIKKKEDLEEFERKIKEFQRLRLEIIKVFGIIFVVFECLEKVDF